MNTIKYFQWKGTLIETFGVDEDNNLILPNYFPKNVEINKNNQAIKINDTLLYENCYRELVLANNINDHRLPYTVRKNDYVLYVTHKNTWLPMTNEVFDLLLKDKDL